MMLTANFCHIGSPKCRGMGEGVGKCIQNSRIKWKDLRPGLLSCYYVLSCLPPFW